MARKRVTRTPLAAGTARQLSRFVIGHYKPKLRRGVYNRLADKARGNIAADRPALGFLPKPKPKPTPKPKPPGEVLPAQYQGLPPDAVAQLRGILTRGQAHQQHARDVMAATGARLDALTNAQAQSQANYQQNMAQVAGIQGAAAQATPLAAGTSAGSTITTSPFGYLNTAAGEFAGVQAQGAQQRAAVGSHLSNLINQNTNQGISGQLALAASQIGAQYAQQHDQYLSSLRAAMQESRDKAAQAQAEQENRLAIARMQSDTSRYGDRLDLIGSLIGQRGLDARAQLQSDTTLATAGINADTRRETTAANAAQRALDRQQRTELAAANRRLQQWKTNITTRNQRAGKDGLTPNQQRSLRLRIATEYQRWWTGRPGQKGIGPDGEDIILPGTASGGRAETERDRTSGAISAMGYLSGLGADGSQIVQLMLRHFRREEIEAARNFLGLE